MLTLFAPLALVACEAANQLPPVGTADMDDTAGSGKREEQSVGSHDASMPSYLDAGSTWDVLGAGPETGTNRTEDAARAPVRSRTSLILHERWKVLDAHADPFDDRPPNVRCVPLGAAAEELSGESVLAVDTGLCDDLTASQSTLADVHEGDLLKVRLWHFELDAPAPAQAHTAITVDGEVLLDRLIPIPSPAGLITAELRAMRNIPGGAPVYFHLHNHGANTWALGELSAGAASASVGAR